MFQSTKWQQTDKPAGHGGYQLSIGHPNYIWQLGNWAIADQQGGLSGFLPLLSLLSNVWFFIPLSNGILTGWLALVGICCHSVVWIGWHGLYDQATTDCHANQPSAVTLMVWMIEQQHTDSRCPQRLANLPVCCCSVVGTIFDWQAIWPQGTPVVPWSSKPRWFGWLCYSRPTGQPPSAIVWFPLWFGWWRVGQLTGRLTLMGICHYSVTQTIKGDLNDHEMANQQADWVWSLGRVGFGEKRDLSRICLLSKFVNFSRTTEICSLKISFNSWRSPGTTWRPAALWIDLD